MSRRWTLVAVLAVVMSFPLSADAQACVDPPVGMTAWWTGDGNTADIFGTSPGTLVGDTSYASGKVGQAFSFDGTGDYVEISDSAAGDFGDTEFTVDFWFYANSMGATDAYLIGKSHPDGGAAHGWDIRLGDETIRVVGVNGWAFNITSAAIISIGTWHHVALTATDTAVVLYIDGASAGTSDRATISTAPNPLRFGMTTNYGGTALNGLIDEVEFFDRPLTSTEVQSIYNSGAAGKCRPCVALPSDAVGWWRAEEEAVDGVGAYNGTPTGDATWEAGKVGKAFSFAGAGHVLLPKVTAWDFGAAAFSIATWFKGSAVGYANMIWYHNGSNEGYWGLRFEPGGAVQFVIGDQATPTEQALKSFAVVDDDAWHHVVAIRDAGGGQIRLYVDGAEAATPIADLGFNIVGAANANAAIGAGLFGDGVTRFSPFGGEIDEMAIFDRALTVDEVEGLFNSGATGACTSCTDPPSGLVSLWRGDDSAQDEMGTNDGILVNGAAFAAGFVGQALELEGADDYVEVPHDASLSFATTDPMTVDLWVYRTGTATAQHLFGKRSGCSGSSFNYQIVLDSLYNTGLCFATSTGSTQSVCGNSEMDDIPLNTWTHVAATFDGVTKRVFLDGVEVASAQGTLGTPDESALRIGTSGSCGSFGQDFQGLIDEVEVHDRALSRDEISAIYNARAYGKCVLDSTPDAFTFTDVTGVSLSSTGASEPITVSGINVSSAISIGSCTGTSCEYSINQGSWTSAAGTVVSGDEVEVRQTSSGTYATTTDLVLDIGGVTDTFSMTTLRQFTLTVSRTGDGTGTVTSAPDGIDCGSDCQEIFVEGTTVTLTATPDQGFEFVAWSGASDCGDGEVTMTATTSCTARFDTTAIFSDDFETTNTSRWSASVGLAP